MEKEKKQHGHSHTAKKKHKTDEENPKTTQTFSRHTVSNSGLNDFKSIYIEYLFIFSVSLFKTERERWRVKLFIA